MSDPGASAAAEPGFGMTDLEERLQGTEGPALHAAVMSRLTQLDEAFGAMVRQGLGPEQFKQAQALSRALVAARSFLSGAS